MYKTDDDMLARATIETWVIKAEKGERDCCPKCDGRVFEAEKMVTASVIIFFSVPKDIQCMVAAQKHKSNALVRN